MVNGVHGKIRQNVLGVVVEVLNTVKDSVIIQGSIYAV